MKTYSRVPQEIDRMVASIKAQYYAPQLDAVTVDVLFVYDADDEEKHALSAGGYPAQATIRLSGIDERVLGTADAVIVIERANWLKLSQVQRLAVLDHELYHLHPCWDPENLVPVMDAVQRPKLKMRKHDHQLGWFDEIAARHGKASAEVMQATALVEATGQLYWDFEARPQAKAALRVVSNIGASAQ